MWRDLDVVDHASVCRELKLDPHTHRVDLSAPNAAGERCGLVFRDGVDRPVGRVAVPREGGRFRDVDPLNAADFESFRIYADDR